MSSASRAPLRDDRHVMADDRDNRPDAGPLGDKQFEREVGCAFWSAALAGGLILLLAGYGLAAMTDGAVHAMAELARAVR